MYNEKKNDVDWKKLAKTIYVGIRFLDDVLTANHYPIPECKTAGERSRRIGLGVTGLHYLLIKLGHVYGDEKCIEFLDRLFATFRNEAYKASVSIAKEKGSFPAFDVDKYCQEEFFKQLPPRLQTSIKRHGIRNAVMLTIAPCGTNSMVLGVSSGVEPIFAPVYKRHFRDGNIWREEYVADKLFSEFYTEGKDLDHFRGAYDVPVEGHISVQATIQKYIDSAISKTTNLPNEFDKKDLADVVLEYASYVKGFTIYRAGSKGTEPLEPMDISSKDLLEEAMEKAGVQVLSIEACKDGKCDL
jgi:ribonucleoside-diphosphate reductase alpha chain